MSVNQDIQDAVIRHMVFISRLQNGEAAKIGRVIQDAIPSIEREIADRVSRMRAGSRMGKMRLKQLRAMRDELLSMIQATEWARILSADMRSLALTEATWLVRMLERTVPAELGIKFTRPPAQLLRSIVSSKPFDGKVLSQWTAGVNRSTVDRVSRVVNAGLVRGDDVGTMSQAVRAQLGTTKAQAQAVTRTAVNHVSTAAREETYQENEDVVSSVKWVATLDTRTSPICIALDGKVFPVDEGPRPPAHFNCRSTTVPVLKSWKELGIDAKELSPSTRASMDGQVPADMTYGEWLRKQSAEVQDEVLGPGKAALFRKGELDVSDLVDDNLRPLSLRELRRKARSQA